MAATIKSEMDSGEPASQEEDSLKDNGMKIRIKKELCVDPDIEQIIIKEESPETQDENDNCNLITGEIQKEGDEEHIKAEEPSSINQISITSVYSVNDDSNPDTNVSRGSDDFSANVHQNEHTVIKTEMTDEEIMVHLDEIENIVLHSPSFIMQDDFECETKENVDEFENVEKKVKPEVSVGEENISVIIIEEERAEDERVEEKQEEETQKEKDMEVEEEESKETVDQMPKSDSEKTTKKDYIASQADKLQAKEDVVKDRLQRLSRVLEYSYPLYKRWLHKVERNKGTSVCQLDKSVHIPANKRHTHRWKFACQKINIVDNKSKDKTKEIVWKVKPSNILSTDVDNECLFPPYIMNIAKDFEEYLQNDPEVHKENTYAPDAKRDERKEFTAFNIRANYQNELMIIVVGYNVTNKMLESLRKFFKCGGGNYKHIKSVYCKSFCTQIQSVKNHASTTFLWGSEFLEDRCGQLKILVAPKTNFWTNFRGIELIVNVVNDYLPPWPNTTLVEIGCGIGMLSLSLKDSFNEAIGVDAETEIEEARKICEYNDIKNVTFVNDEKETIEKLFQDLKNHNRLVAIINHNAVCGKSIEMIGRLRRLKNLKRLVVIVTFSKQSIHSIMELMHPYRTNDTELGNPFIPQRCCLIDTVPQSTQFELAMVMERRFMRKIPPDNDVVEIPPPKKNSDYERAINPMYNATEMNMDLRNQIVQKRSNKQNNPNKRPFQPAGSNRNYPHTEIESTEVVEVLENVKQQQAILEQAAKKLSHSNIGMDSDTARQLQSMLNTVLEQTNEIQNKLPKIAQEEVKRKEPMELPVLVPGKSKYQNVALLEPNTFTVCRGRGGTVNRIDRSNRGGATRRPVRERLNGYIENGSPPREVTENVDWEQYEDKTNSPDRYESNQRGYNSSGRQTNFNKGQNKYEQNRKQRYRGSQSPNRGKQYRNYKDNQHNRQSPTRSVHSPSRGSYYSRSGSRNLSTSPRRRVSRSRSPNHHRYHRTSRDDDRVSVSPHRRRQYSPQRKRRRFESRNSPNIIYEEDEYRDNEWRRSEERRNDRMDEDSYDSYTTETRYRQRNRSRTQSHESDRYKKQDRKICHYTKSPDVVVVRSRSSSPRDRWSPELRNRKNNRVEKTTKRPNDQRPKQKRQTNSNREDDLPEDAKDPWGGDESNVVINPVASANEDPNRYWNQQNQWQQVAPPQQQWVPMQAPPTLAQPVWGPPPISQMPIVDQNARQPVGMHRPIAPLMNQPQMVVPGMGPPPQMCPPAQMPCNGMQQNWNQNVPPQPQMGARMPRFRNSHVWRNPNFNKGQKNSRQRTLERILD